MNGFLVKAKNVEFGPIFTLFTQFSEKQEFSKNEQLHH